MCAGDTCPPARKEYLMYAWSKGWDRDVSAACDENYLAWDDDPANDVCFTHNWDTVAKRDQLFCTCNRMGREVGTLLLSSVSDTLEARDCSGPGVGGLRETLGSGHTVPGLKIYGLFAASNVAVTEKEDVLNLVWYNDNCAENYKEKFDGVALNNEAFEKDWEDAEVVAYLTNLKEFVSNAGGLRTHYSLGWHWYKRSGGGPVLPIEVTFLDVTQNVVQHMVDMFHSVDVQVATVKGELMVDRLQRNLEGGATLTPPTLWSHALESGTRVFTTLYTNKGDGCADCDDDCDCDCPTHYFPRDGCSPAWSAYHTEARMWTEVSAAESSLPGFTPALHAYRNAYGAGVPGWGLGCTG
jgi:hypothetical protein